MKIPNLLRNMYVSDIVVARRNSTQLAYIINSVEKVSFSSVSSFSFTWITRKLIDKLL